MLFRSQRTVRPVSAPDAGSGETTPQLGSHLHDALPPVSRVPVEPFAEINGQVQPIPGGGEADLRPQERFVAFGRPARGGRAWSDVANQLSVHEVLCNRIFAFPSPWLSPLGRGNAHRSGGMGPRM